jgi:signal transduction histidine kinase
LSVRRPGRRRLYVKLYLAFLGMLVAAAATFVGVHLLLGRGAFDVWRGGPRLASHLARTLPPPNEREEMQRALEQANEELGLDLAVIDERGVDLAAAGAQVRAPADALAGRARHFAAWIEPGIVAAPLPRHDGVRYFLLVRIPLPPGARAAVLPVRLGVILVGVLLISAALLYPLSRSITRPLERLTATAEAFGRGDLSARSGIAAEDEVGRLARSFDEMAARTQAARRAEKELLANVSHELRTPLARMKVVLELIDGRDDPGMERRIRSLDEEIDELDRMVGDVLTASRLDLASLPLRPVRLRALEILEKSRQRALALSGAPIEVKAESDLVLTGDEALLSRALDNLIENARKHAGGGQPVRVEARRENGEVLVSVRDHGPGFRPEELPRVFDPFFRGEDARARTAGFGLGLALARRVAEAHGGSIRALNADGGGARMELRLPA